MTSAAKTSHYIHGAAPEEQERLSKLNEILNDSYLRKMGLRTGQSVLDVGSGLGNLTRMMARQVAPAGKVLGIERDPQQLAAARQLTADDHSQAQLEFRQGDALHLPLDKEETGTFDLAQARFVLEHIPQPERAISQMLESLHPGGRIILSDDDHLTFRPTPEPAGFPAIWQAYLRSYDRLGNDPFIGRRLVTLLHEAGVQEIRNSIVFFGGCAHQAVFPLAADNLIGVLLGARGRILEETLLSADVFDQAIQGLRHWKERPEAALWYGICWAEGIKRKV